MTTLGRAARRAPHQRQVSRFASGLKIYGGTRMTLELRRKSAGVGANRLGRRVRVAPGFGLLLAPPSGGGARFRWGKSFWEGDTLLPSPPGTRLQRGLCT